MHELVHAMCNGWLALAPNEPGIVTWAKHQQVGLEPEVVAWALHMQCAMVGHCYCMPSCQPMACISKCIT